MQAPHVEIVDGECGSYLFKAGFLLSNQGRKIFHSMLYGLSSFSCLYFSALLSLGSI